MIDDPNPDSLNTPIVNAAATFDDAATTKAAVVSPFSSPGALRAGSMLDKLHRRTVNLAVLSEDKSVMLSIPPHLIDPTEGCAQYLLQEKSGQANCKFHLCHLYRAGRCNFGMYCGYIHSKHVRDPSLQADISVSPVHKKVLLRSLSESTYSRHEPGTSLTIGDSRSHLVETVDSGLIYVTAGSSAAVSNYSSCNGASLPPIVRCHFYEHGVCSRGSACLYIHVVAMDPSVHSSNPPVGPTPPPYAKTHVEGIANSAVRRSGQPMNHGHTHRARDHPIPFHKHNNNQSAGFPYSQQVGPALKFVTPQPQFQPVIITTAQQQLYVPQPHQQAFCIVTAPPAPTEPQQPHQQIIILTTANGGTGVPFHPQLQGGTSTLNISPEALLRALQGVNM